MGVVMDRGPAPPLPAGTRVLIVEEQEVLRRGLLAITDAIPGVRASAVTEIGTGDVDTDVTLISTTTLMNAERAGISLDRLRPVIVIAAAAQPGSLDVATSRRANGYLLQRDLTPGSLRDALTQVLHGRLVIPEPIAAYLLDRARNHSVDPPPRLEHLSARETEVLNMLVTGASNKEIANRLGISIHGVKRHVSTLLNQFHSPNRVHLVSHILRSGVISSLDPGAR